MSCKGSRSRRKPGVALCVSLSSENEFVRKLVKMEDNLIEGDPGFVAPEKGDFRLKADSPALKLGFKPIPFDRIGPHPDEDR